MKFRLFCNTIITKLSFEFQEGISGFDSFHFKNSVSESISQLAIVIQHILDEKNNKVIWHFPLIIRWSWIFNLLCDKRSLTNLIKQYVLKCMLRYIQTSTLNQDNNAKHKCCLALLNIRNKNVTHNHKH